MIGSSVYEPLAQYYLENHDAIKKLILQQIFFFCRVRIA